MYDISNDLLGVLCEYNHKHLKRFVFPYRFAGPGLHSLNFLRSEAKYK